MAKPFIHAKSSAKKYGGKWEDYFPIHDFMDCSKGAFPDNRHRTLTHNAWFIKFVLERVHFPNSGPMTADGSFPTIVNSDGKHVSVREIGEQHILEDFGMKFIPSAADYLESMEMEPWMNNGMAGDTPPSYKKLKGTSMVEKLARRKIAAGEID